MNVLRDAAFLVVSYPYSVMRRLTSSTWTYLWSRGLFNYLPFIRKKPIMDTSERIIASTSASTSKKSSADTSIKISSDDEVLDSTLVMSTESMDEKEHLGEIVVTVPGFTNFDVVPVPATIDNCQSVSVTLTNLDGSATNMPLTSPHELLPESKQKAISIEPDVENQLSASDADGSNPPTFESSSNSDNTEITCLDLHAHNRKEEASSSTSPAKKEEIIAVLDDINGNEEVLKSPIKKPEDDENLPTYMHLAAKRHSSTLEEETIRHILDKNDAKTAVGDGDENKVEEFVIPSNIKKPKLELSATATPTTNSTHDSNEQGKKAHENASLSTNFKGIDETKKKLPHRGDDERLPYTHFIGIQMSNPEIHAKFEEIQRRMLEKEFSHESFKKFRTGRIFENTMISSRRSHITLHVFHLKDEEQLEAAKTGVQKVWEAYKDEFEKNPVSLKVEGVGHFNNSVLFAKVSGLDHIKKLREVNEMLKEEFRMLDIYGETKPYKSHLTLAKMSNAKDAKDKSFFRRHNIRGYPRELWRDFESTCFGYQTVESFQFLKMRPDPATGYYEIVETYPFDLSKAHRQDNV